jgi:hypothetical protein
MNGWNRRFRGAKPDNAPLLAGRIGVLRICYLLSPGNKLNVLNLEYRLEGK